MANSTLVAVMGQLACYSGKPVTWEEVKKSNFQFGPPPEEANFDSKPVGLDGKPVLMDNTGNYPLPMPGITKVL